MEIEPFFSFFFLINHIHHFTMIFMDSCICITVYTDRKNSNKTLFIKCLRDYNSFSKISSVNIRLNSILVFAF